ncbi:Maltose transport system permease protein MalF [Pseudovibrio sp. FO-BEG1]|uniref:Carbohydrate ABC transporter membrane protein 1, CUT1 family n=1 Tax=Pseudovibrio denitrificans TaxID=258256 RepID=A0A1I6Z3K7_9HYPH|nr:MULTISPECIES: sugar ABC transporter permease [Pseudovibrio]AEV39067.1 Maltose transport system permease protein MalF [Pseudovibrio sp. FO-BEG1]EEA92042.1 binding-protein-dependent transport systems inner membrane component [Pseudovibrio sp. JE062]SFT57313.1 carbohydrate ABC transporter membrane protein 1, CUT1 family [Pseudovibrio denitrificans]
MTLALQQDGTATRKAKRSNLSSARLRAAWLFLAPMMIALAAVAGWPLLRTIWLGFTDANLIDLSESQFIGFENYLAFYDGEAYGVLVDAEWWNAVWNTLWFSVISVGLETLFGLIIALILNAEFKGRGLVRAAVLIPWAIPTIVSAKMWGWMLHDQFGVINEILLGVGILSEPVAWTADPSTAMWAVIMVDVWKTTPFMALLTLAALQMLPGDIYEAARVDGINPIRVFFKVTLPLIRPAIIVAVIFRSLDALRVFDLIYVLTSNSTSTMSMSVYARQQLVDFQEVGYGSAAATLLFIVIALLTTITVVAGGLKSGEGDQA